MEKNGVNQETVNKEMPAHIVIPVQSNNSTLKFTNQLNAMMYNRLVIVHVESSVHLRMLTVSVPSSIVRKTVVTYFSRLRNFANNFFHSESYLKWNLYNSNSKYITLVV